MSCINQGINITTYRCRLKRWPPSKLLVKVLQPNHQSNFAISFLLPSHGKWIGFYRDLGISPDSYQDNILELIMESLSRLNPKKSVGSIIHQNQIQKQELLVLVNFQTHRQSDCSLFGRPRGETNPFGHTLSKGNKIPGGNFVGN